MAAGAKLEKSFEDYFRIPILLKAIGETSQQTINQMATVLNQIDRFPINDNQISLQASQYSVYKQKIKKNQQLIDRILNEMKNRIDDSGYKLLFLSQDFDNDWSQFQIMYRVSFVILIYSGQEFKKSFETTEYKKNETDLNQKINKINLRLKQKDKQIIGIIFLNDLQEYSKNLMSRLKFTIIPPTLPREQLSFFIEPWIGDLISLIEQNIIEHILQCKYEENSVIVFNRSEDKSQPKIMKKKKKFRCLKICGDLALMLHLYQFAYQSYNEADEQLRKVQDWMWVLGCIQGKIACMTSQTDLKVKQENIEKQIEQLINESFVYGKKVKQQSFDVENLFKILKLLLSYDKPRFDELVENTLSNTKGLTEEQQFIYYSYIGSMYEQAKMERKRNYFYYRASVIIESFKPQISQLLLKAIHSSKFISEWDFLNSQVVLKIIQNQKYFNSGGDMRLYLIQKCNSVLNQKQIESIKDYLNYGHFERKIMNENTNMVLIKDFRIVESDIKPKPNRLINDESPKKINTSGIFVGWKKKYSYLYEEDEAVMFKGTVVNKLPFEIRVVIEVDVKVGKSAYKRQQFGLIVPGLNQYKFQKWIKFKYNEQLVSIKKIKYSLWNFVFQKDIDPQICFEVYEKQPNFQLSFNNKDKHSVDNQNNLFEIQESSLFSLVYQLKRNNAVWCDRMRITCSVYYDIDVGFQENQYTFISSNNFLNINLISQNQTPNIKFIESEQKESAIEFDENQKILLLKLKKFKTARSHIKKFEIILDYIRQQTSKHQISKQYIIETKIVNSVWAEIVQISTPGLQSALQHLRNFTKSEVEQFIRNWNVIEDFYLIKVKFLKDKFNLRPFKVWYAQKQQKNATILSQNMVILSNLTQGEMWIKLKKQRINLKQKQLMFSPKYQQEKIFNPLLKSLIFKWENIVNKNMHGIINLNIKPSPLILRPNLKIEAQVKPFFNLRQTENDSKNCLIYLLIYQITSENEDQIKPHKVSIKAYSEAQVENQLPEQSEGNQCQMSMVKESNDNFSILIKGKTKVNKIIFKKSFQNLQQALNDSKLKDFKCFQNSLTIKIVKQKVEQVLIMQKNSGISILITIQFEQKQIGKWQSIIKLP